MKTLACWIGVVGACLLCTAEFGHGTEYVVPGGAGAGTGESWSNAWASVQDAINSADPGGEDVWVKKGRYSIASAINATNNVRLYGGFNGDESALGARDFENNLTILDGGASSRILWAFSNSNVRIDGLIFARAGGAGAYGGAIDADYATAIQVLNCKFLNNSFSNAGALSLQNVVTNALVSNCVFSGNTTPDTGLGVAIRGQYGTAGGVTIINCVFTGHTSGKGTIQWSYGTDHKIKNCLFVGDMPGMYGGVYMSSCVLEIINNTFAYSSASYGGNIYIAYSQPTLRNNIFAYTRAPTAGYAALHEGSASSDPVVQNCLFFGIQANKDYYDDDTATILTNAAQINAITNYLGSYNTNNVDGAPLFATAPTSPDNKWESRDAYNADTVSTTFYDTQAAYVPGALKGMILDPDTSYLPSFYRHALIKGNTATSITVWGDATTWGGTNANYVIHDYRLRAGSAAINAGSTNGAPATDFLGNVRGNEVDIGAFEYIPPPRGTMFRF